MEGGLACQMEVQRLYRELLGLAQKKPELWQDSKVEKGWLSGLVEIGTLRGTDDFLFRNVGRKDNWSFGLHQVT